MKRLELNRLKPFAELTAVMAFREIQGRYKGSLLGPLWVIMYPLFLTSITTLVFSVFIKVSTGSVPYPVFALSGIMVWNFFAKSMNFGTRSLVLNRELLVGTAVKAEAIPLSYILGQLPDVFINLCLLIIVAAVYGYPINVLHLLLIPVIYVFLAAFIYGLTLLFSTLDVMYKDTQNLLDPLVMVWFYLTPIAYSTSYVPAALRWILWVNPMHIFISTYRKILLQGTLPSLTDVGLICLFTGLSLTVGWSVFKRYRPGFADVI